jgi:hypothetical protein
MIGINLLIIMLLYLMDRVIFLLFIINNYLYVCENAYHFCYFNTLLLR